MTRRFADFRLPRAVPTTGEVIAAWIAIPLALMVVTLVGCLLVQFFPQSYG